MLEKRVGVFDERMVLGRHGEYASPQFGSPFRFAAIEAAVLIEQFAEGSHATNRAIRVLFENLHHRAMEVLARFVDPRRVDFDHATSKVGIRGMRRGGQAVGIDAAMITSGDGEFAGKHRSSSAFEIA